MAKLDIHFITNTPKAPWRAGAIESLVAQVKHLMREKLMERSGKIMTLISHQNMLKNIISHINDRPLVLYPDERQVFYNTQFPTWERFNTSINNPYSRPKEQKAC